MTRKCKVQAEGWVSGICYFSGRLYTTEGLKQYGRPGRYRLAVYSVSYQDTFTLLDTLELKGIGYEQPRVDRQTSRVYIACSRSGVYVVRYSGSELVLVTTLSCVRNAYGLAVASRDTLYVCDMESGTVCLVDVIQDRVTDRIQKPHGVSRRKPDGVAVLGDTLLVVYGGDSLAILRHNAPTPDKALGKLEGLVFARGITTDHDSSFLVTNKNTVYVLDISGNLTHTIPIPEGREIRDCTVVGEQLWVGCEDGHIIVMSSQ